MPIVADTVPLYTILFGDLPLLVTRELVRLVAVAPDLRLVGPVMQDMELALQVQNVRPSVIIVSGGQLAALSGGAISVPVLLYESETGTDLMQPQEGSRWGLAGIIERLPHLLAERASWRQSVLQKMRLTAKGLNPPRWLGARTPFVPVPTGLVVIGASTGGPLAVEKLLAQLHSNARCAIVVAVHLPASFTASFVTRLRRTSALPVVAAEAGTRLLAGQVVVVPGGANMAIRRGPGGHWTTCLAPESGPTGSDVPSVDVLMCSAATAASRVLGVVLTGLGHDGTQGARAIREHGGQVLVQDATSAAVFSMPGAVLRAGWASAALPLVGLAAAINTFGCPPKEVSAAPRRLVLTAHAA